MRNPRGVKFYLVVFRIQPRLFFWQRVANKAVAVYEIRGAPSIRCYLQPLWISYTATPFFHATCNKNKRGCIRNPKGANFNLPGFRIQPRLFFGNEIFTFKLW